MARARRAESAKRTQRLRAELVAALRAQLDKLPADSEIMNFGPKRELLAARIAELEAGVDGGQFQTYELPAAALAAVGLRSRFDPEAPKLWRLVDNRLVPDEPDRT